MLFINLAGIGLIVLIVWWFWLYQSKGTVLDVATQAIIVDKGVYEPAYIKLPANQPVTIQFIRKDASPCAEMVQFPDLDISETLPLDKEKKIMLPAMQAGTYPFHCQMQMYRGELKVE